MTITRDRVSLCGGPKIAHSVTVLVYAQVVPGAVVVE